MLQCNKLLDKIKASLKMFTIRWQFPATGQIDSRKLVWFSDETRISLMQVNVFGRSRKGFTNLRSISSEALLIAFNMNIDFFNYSFLSVTPL